MLGINLTPNLGKYLGFSLKHSGSTSQDFNFVVERVQNKLQGWKASLLLMVGRVVMAQIVLSVILAYVMQGCILPARVLNNLDKFNRNFVWGLTDEKKKMHMVNWKQLLDQSTEGAWEFRKLEGEI